MTTTLRLHLVPVLVLGLLFSTAHVASAEKASFIFSGKTISNPANETPTIAVCIQWSTKDEVQDGKSILVKVAKDDGPEAVRDKVKAALEADADVKKNFTIKSDKMEIWLDGSWYWVELTSKGDCHPFRAYCVNGELFKEGGKWKIRNKCKGGMELGGGVGNSPVIGTVFFDILGVPTDGSVAVAVDTCVASDTTFARTIPQIKDEIVDQLQGFGVDADLMDSLIVVRHVDLNALSGLGDNGPGLYGYKGGGAAAVTDTGLAVWAEIFYPYEDWLYLVDDCFMGGPSSYYSDSPHGVALAGTTWIGYTPSGSGPWKIGAPGCWNFDDGGTLPCPIEDDDQEYIKNGAYAQGWASEDAALLYCGLDPGDYAAIRDRNSFINNDLCEFQNCDMAGCVLAFYNPNIPGQYGNGGHYAGWFFDRAWSPTIDMTSYPSRGYCLAYDRYADLPIENWIFYRCYVRYVQDVNCPTGAWSSPKTDDYIYYKATPTCNTKYWGFSQYVPVDADSVQIGLAAWNGCDFWETTCTNGNESPIFDNIKVGIWDLSAPQASIRAVDNYTDAFPENDALAFDATDVAMIDAANNKSQQGDFLRLADTAIVQLDAPNVQAELCFRVIPGLYTDLTDAFFTADYPDAGGWVACEMSDDVFCTRMDTAFSAGNGIVGGTYEFQVTFEGYFATMIHEADANWPGYEGEEIWPDSLFTPGTQIYYAFRTKFVGGASETWLPQGADLVNDPLGTAFEVSVLPDLCKDPLACLIYFDYYNRGSQVPIENALTLLGRQWDRFDLRAESSHQGNGIGNRKLGPGRYRLARGPIGPSIDQLSQYKVMLLNNGSLDAGTTFSDGGTGTPDDPTNDVDFLDQWVNEGRFKGLWLSGDNIATDFATATIGPKPGFLAHELATDLVASSYQEWSGHPVADNCRVLKTRDGEMRIVNTYSVRDSMRIYGSGCPANHTYDVLTERDGEPGLEFVSLMYDLSDGYASVDHIFTAPNAPYDTVRTKIDGFSLHDLRNLSPPCNDIDNIGIATWLRDVLGGVNNNGYFYDRAGEFQYCPPDGMEDPILDVPGGPGDPKRYVNALFQNYPNPFRGISGTTIHYSVKKAGAVEIRIFDVAGRLVNTMVDQSALGDNFVQWDGKNTDDRKVASGVYFYQLKAGEFTSHKKMLVVN